MIRGELLYFCHMFFSLWRRLGVKKHAKRENSSYCSQSKLFGEWLVFCVCWTVNNLHKTKKRLVIRIKDCRALCFYKGHFGDSQVSAISHVRKKCIFISNLGGGGGLDFSNNFYRIFNWMIYQETCWYFVVYWEQDSDKLNALGAV